MTPAQRAELLRKLSAGEFKAVDLDFLLDEITDRDLKLAAIRDQWSALRDAILAFAEEEKV